MTWRAPWIGVTVGAPAPGAPGAGARPGYRLDAGYVRALSAAGGFPVGYRHKGGEGAPGRGGADSARPWSGRNG